MKPGAHLTDLQFKDLELPEVLHRGIEQAGFSHCTPIQAATLPVILAHEDVAGQAQTGTGKTATFLLACFNRLLSRPAPDAKTGRQPRALILAPTRELAVQIHHDAEILGQYTGLVLGLAYGGTGYESQRQHLQQGVDILIGTPGRLIDYYKQKVFHLKDIEVSVIDEADRMFDLGFIRDIRYLLRRMPPPEQRLTMLFSATLSYRVSELAYEHMNNPKFVQVEPERVTAEQVTQRIYYPANEEKIPLLLGLLQHMDPRRSIVFVNTKRTAEIVWSYLQANELNAAVLSGDVPQKKRLSLLRRFQSGELPVLVATDVAARGLHIPEVSHVFNFDLPQDAEDYVHRIGRTARAGAAGDAISFACENYVYSLQEIEAYIGHQIPQEAVTEELLVVPKRPPRSERSQRRGKPQGPRRKPSGSGRRRRGTRE